MMIAARNLRKERKNRMKVYVMTKFKPFGKEEYVGVKKSQKEAVKALRQLFPHMRGDVERGLSADATNELLLRIREEEI